MANHVSQEHIGKIVESYIPSCRYLYDVDIDFPKAKGIFRLNNTYHTVNALDHMTPIEAQLCLNQLSYAAFGEWLSNDVLDYQMRFEDFLVRMRENIFVTDSHIRFNKPIDSRRAFGGTINVERLKRVKSGYIAIISYELDNNRSEGQMKLALRF